jgi:hypothetical protein
LLGHRRLNFGRFCSWLIFLLIFLLNFDDFFQRVLQLILCEPNILKLQFKQQRFDILKLLESVEQFEQYFPDIIVLLLVPDIILVLLQPE